MDLRALVRGRSFGRGSFLLPGSEDLKILNRLGRLSGLTPELTWAGRTLFRIFDGATLLWAVLRNFWPRPHRRYTDYDDPADVFFRKLF